MRKKYNIIIVGAGLFGIVAAERLSESGKSVLLIERRNHIGGNCYDTIDEKTNIRFHKYGPHIFHINNKYIIDYIKKFTTYKEYFHKVLSIYKDKIYPIPINLQTINDFFCVRLKPFEVRDFLQRKIEKEHLTTPVNLEEKIISLIGRELYTAFFEEYTIKQWGKHPRLLPPSIINRIPFRDNYFDCYYQKKYYFMPIPGFTEMFSSMLKNKSVDIIYNFDFNKERYKLPYSDYIIYTGAIDEYFDYQYGKLEYRSLQFEYEYQNYYDFQGISVINYPELRYNFTRICEPKHFYKEKWHTYSNDFTLIIKEYPKNFNSGERYYPICDDVNTKILQKYKLAAQQLKNVYFGGRLGEFKYYDMEDTISSALNLSEKINNKYL